jgi:hypothetical protein
MILKKIPAESVRWMVICSLGVVLFVALTIYPTNRSIRELDAKIAVFQNQIESQKTLLPLYEELNKLLNSSKPPSLSAPEPGTYPRDQVEKVSSIFDGLVRETGLSLTAVAPDLYAFTNDPSMLPVRLALRGSFFDFQRFLKGLGMLPVVSRIEEVSVRHIPGGREFEARVVLAVGD